MTTWRTLGALALLVVGLPCDAQAAPQQAGSIRGVVFDQDFDEPLQGVEVLNLLTKQTTTTSEQGTYLFPAVAPGRYTLVYSKQGYIKQVRANVVVVAGLLTDVDIHLTGDFAEMDEFVVQDALELGAGSESALLDLRFDSPSLLDSIGADLMSRAGASDAASALRLVSGASIQDGKFAVIRGLPDRYVSSQLNGIRLPTSDEDKRAVELDQFPSAVIESIQVSKTFTPDQQGDASGGAVDVRLKGVPDEAIFEIKAQVGYNSNTTGRGSFLNWAGGGMDTWGNKSGLGIQSDELGQSWSGAVGVSETEAPDEFKWSGTIGGKQALESGFDVGGLLSFFYERDTSYSKDGRDDALWQVDPGDGLTPEISQGTVSDGNFLTSLFDIERGSVSVQWGGLATFGIESDTDSIGLTYLYTRTAESSATLAENTRGKEYFFPGYDPDDPMGPGNTGDEDEASPYLRTETLEYSERTVGTLQLHGRHEVPIGEFGWTVGKSSAELDQPDKRQFAEAWFPNSFNPGIPGLIPPSIDPAKHTAFKPSATFSLGNLQRIFKTVHEDSQTLALSLKMPFTLEDERGGYVKFGAFADSVDREYTQQTFSNFNDLSPAYFADFDDKWSTVWGSQSHPITGGLTDVPYDANQDIRAVYGMTEFPLSSEPVIKLIGGVRVESTEIGVTNFPEAQATWFPPGSIGPVQLADGAGDVAIEQTDILPSIGVVYEPADRWTLRASLSRTTARQTFKELTPILQQEFVGGPVFIGNPFLRTSEVTNYDLRAEFVPYEGGLISASLFKKEIDDAIEYVQRQISFTFTTPTNYPSGELTGLELELRQELGRFAEPLDGFSLGANATFIESRVVLPADEVAALQKPEIAAPLFERDMTNAPEHLFNLYLTYDLPETGTQFGLFYTIQGDTLLAGPGEAKGNFIPSIYAAQYDTLNFSVSQKLWGHFKLQFQAKNLTDPDIRTVYRSQYIGADVEKSSFSRGIDFSISLSASFAL